MARPKSWQWDHFYKGSKKYQNNKTHFEAYCNYCTEAKLLLLQAQEKSAVDAGQIEAERATSVLIVEARTLIPVTAGKVATMNNHLLACEYCPEATRARARGHKGDGEDDDQNDEGTATSQSETVLAKRGRSDSDRLRTDARVTAKKQTTFKVLATQGYAFNPSMQKEFEEDILRAFVSAGYSFNSIHDPEVQKFYAKYLPGARLPNRKGLAGQIIDHEVVKMKSSLRVARNANTFATLQCDGLKDVSKKHLVAFMYTAKCQVHVTNFYDMTEKRKTAANLLPLMEAEYDNLVNDLHFRCIGIAGDAAGDERRARMDLMKKHLHLLVADCWAHQICLILSDYARKNKQVAEIIDSAMEVVKWFNSHLYAMGVFRVEQRSMYGKELTLIMPVITRWTAYFCLFDRLLTVWKALQITAIKHESELIETLGSSPKLNDILKANCVLAQVRDSACIRSHFEPLAIAVNVAQGANTRCDQVLLLLARLHRTYSIMRQETAGAYLNDDEHPVTAILDSLEKHWLKADQDLFIAALFLNPFVNCRKLFNGSVMVTAVIMGILKCLYMRVFRVDKAPSNLLTLIIQYEKREGIFSEESWDIDDLREGLSEKDGTVDPVEVWSTLPKDNPLVCLAMLVLSFVPNSTSTERLFTNITDTKTKKRNWMRTELVRKVTFLKLELRRQHAEEGTARARLKRHFGDSSSAEASKTSKGPIITRSQLEEEEIVRGVTEMGLDGSDSEEGDGEAGGVSQTDASDSASVRVRSFSAIARSLQEEAEHDDNDIGDEELDIGAQPTDQQPAQLSGAPIHQVRLYFRQKRLLTLAELFNYSIEHGWDEFWSEGMKNYKDETAFYELVTEMGQGDGPDSSGVSHAETSGANGAAGHPIEVVD
ncbi:hypothetical protein EWM64_g5859 [Hericium alpestre]|uniref:Uncharacterized protein n=1 Tax=Hericium alpestre TaxID=135208 RepID=A0A4Y9ZTC7_9AGAM|nr:hypothetical protein EWM64_g5859 [Hericium alpestre]